MDESLAIKSFTPQLKGIYNISKVDVGRPISHITNLAKEMPEFPSSEQVVVALKPIENDIQMQDGRWILRRVSSYRTTEGSYSGLVGTYIDVTHLRMAQERYRQLAESMPQIVWTADADGDIDYFNERWTEYTGFSRNEELREGWSQAIHPDDNVRVMKLWDSCLQSGQRFETEYRLKEKRTGLYRWFLTIADCAKDFDGKITKWFGSCVDIDKRVRSEELRREGEKRFQLMADSAPVLIWISGSDKSLTWFNKGWLEWTGRTMDKEVGSGWTDNIHPDDLAGCLKTYEESFDARREFYTEYRLRHHSGEYRWISDRGVPRYTQEGDFEGYIGGCMDITSQRAAQEKILESERRLEMMIRTSPSFMCLLSGPDYIFEEVNEKYMEMVGHHDLLDKSVLQAMPEVKDQGFIEILNKVRETGEYFAGTEVPIDLVRTPGGSPERRYLDFVYLPNTTVDGKVDRIFVHGIDVTEKAQARLSIENERENFRNLFKQTPEMVCILSGPQHLFEFVNEAHERALGFNATGKTVREAQPESVEVHGILDEVYRTGKTAELNEISITLGDRRRFFNLTYAARMDTQGKINGMMILGIEVTKEVLGRTELQQAKDDAEKSRQSAETANESKTRFLANMSHEIRTPLAAILGFSELLKGKISPEETGAMTQLDRISRNAAQLGKLIDELLDLSKIEAERLEIDRSDFDLFASLSDSLSSVSHLARQKGLMFEQSTSGEVPRVINSDLVRFKQILTNVIGNAVKFTETGRVDVELEVKVTQGKHFLQVRVKDTGIGLSPEQQLKIFEPFTQADASVTRKYGGTGLGLVLSRRLARLLGGNLILEESSLGQGSTFTVTIELGEVTISSAALLAKSEVASSAPISLKEKNILVVDDSPDNQTIIQLFLNAAGGHVELANNGLEGVEKMKQRQYDMVLMDIQMPLMDGYQALKVANQSGYRGPIVALTAHAMKEEKERCLAAGFTDYMSKPIDRNLLIQKIYQIISGRS